MGIGLLSVPIDMLFLDVGVLIAVGVADPLIAPLWRPQTSGGLLGKRDRREDKTEK
jgi:hypothetical protein